MRSLAILLVFILTTIHAEEEHNCMNLPHNTSLNDIYSLCIQEKQIRGKGYLDLSKASENMIHTFFASKEKIEMGLQLFGNARPTVMNLGGVKSIGPGGILGALWIENTNLKKINMRKLEVVHGMTVRGNRHLKYENLAALRLKAKPDMLINVQDEGECNILGLSDFTNCKTVNNLILQPFQKIPDSFKPKKIAGCVRIVDNTTPRDFLADVDFSDRENFNCRTPDFKQEIMNNAGLCIKDLQQELVYREFTLSNNGNPSCKLQCDYLMDIQTAGQRWCETIDGDLVINDKLIEKIDLPEVLRNIKTVNGIIKIVNITNETALEQFDGEIEFPQLQFVTGGKVYRDKLIFVDNTAYINISFPKIVSIRGGAKAFVVTDRNPGLYFPQKQYLRIVVAANGRKVMIPKEYVPPVEKKKKAVVDNEKEEGSTSSDEEGDGDSEDNTWVIVGSSLAAVAAVVAIAAVAVIVVVMMKNKKRKSKDKKNNNTVESKVPYKKVPSSPSKESQSKSSKAKKDSSDTKVASMSKGLNMTKEDVKLLTLAPSTTIPSGLKSDADGPMKTKSKETLMRSAEMKTTSQVSKSGDVTSTKSKDKLEMSKEMASKSAEQIPKTKNSKENIVKGGKSKEKLTKTKSKEDAAPSKELKSAEKTQTKSKG